MGYFIIIGCAFLLLFIGLLISASKKAKEEIMLERLCEEAKKSFLEQKNRFKYRTRETIEAFLFQEDEEDYPYWFVEAIQDNKIKVNWSIAGLSTLTIVMTTQNDITAHVGDMIVKIGDEITAMNIHAFIAMYEKVGE